MPQLPQSLCDVASSRLKRAVCNLRSVCSPVKSKHHPDRYLERDGLRRDRPCEPHGDRAGTTREGEARAWRRHDDVDVAHQGVRPGSIGFFTATQKRVTVAVRPRGRSRKERAGRARTERGGRRDRLLGAADARVDAERVVELRGRGGDVSVVPTPDRYATRCSSVLLATPHLGRHDLSLLRVGGRRERRRAHDRGAGRVEGEVFDPEPVRVEALVRVLALATVRSGGGGGRAGAARRAFA